MPAGAGRPSDTEAWAAGAAASAAARAHDGVFELARCLFPDEGFASVYEHLLPRGEELDLYLTKRGFRVPNKSSLCKARRRLGSDVMEEVFRQVAGPVASEESCPTAFWRGLRLEAFDGTVLDVADTPENTAEFTRPAGGAGVGGYPQARVVALVECGTHALIDAAIGGRQQGETTIAMVLATSTGPDTLVLADRNMPGVPLWTAFRRTGAHLLWRLKGPTAQRVEKVLPDGSYLTRMHLDKNLRAAYRRRGEEPPGPVLLRVIEYTVEGSEEVYRLATSLLDPQEAPAQELAALYSQRWESEGISAEVNTARRGSRAVLLSNYPDGVRQEIWTHLTVHHLTHDLMHHAATGTTPALDPDRISFRTAQRLVRRDLFPLLSPSDQRRRVQQSASKLAARPNAARRPRHYPRVVKRRTTQFPTKKPTDQGTRHPTTGFAIAIRSRAP